MRSLLDALQAGRLIELPDNHKGRALQILANLIEAIPGLAVGTDVAGAVLAREMSANTGLGFGWACPHARLPGEGNLLCAIGWSPTDIDYGAPDGRPVRMVIMYLVAENQKNTYLKEISVLAKTLRDNAAFQDIAGASDLAAVRHRLLDLVGTALESAGPDARARMIRLETRAATPPAPALENLILAPLLIVTGGGPKPLVLAQHHELLEVFEARSDLGELLARHGTAEGGGWRILVRGVSNYQTDRALYDCLAVRASSARAPDPKWEDSRKALSPGSPP
ncbi:MAG: PTS sugar transporter subunit IIA [Verrucomicrobiae bacterium]|nr:PTS sugar transporter subunit IIA [Verrucomicrobiae bacterium]